MDVVHKELQERKEEIENQLEKLFKHNLVITDYDIPEANDQEAAEILIDILTNKLAQIKADVVNGEYQNY